MSLYRKRLAAVFFLPREQEPVSVDALLRLAGASRITRPPPAPYLFPETWDCVWGGLACMAVPREHPKHRLLILFFRQGDFIELMSDETGALPLEEDKALPLAQAFARTCEALSPDAAFIVTHMDQAQLEWIEARVRLVESADADRLANERFGLLYMNEEISRRWTLEPILSDRDELPVRHGRLLFSNRESRRWW